jgi:hypothetical protein
MILKAETAQRFFDAPGPRLSRAVKKILAEEF